MQLDLLDRPGRCSGRGPHDSKVREGWGGRRRPQAEAHRPRLRRAARPARAAWTALRLLANVADSILVIFRFGATMERPRRSSAASYGVSSTTIAKFRSTDVVRPPSLAQRSARKDQRNLAALIMIVALMRAREAGRRDAARPARSAWSVQRQLAARFDGEVAVRSPAAPAVRGASAAAAPSSPTGSSRLDGAAAAGQRRRFHFSDIPVRGDDGTTAPVERSQLRGLVDNDRQIPQH